MKSCITICAASVISLVVSAERALTADAEWKVGLAQVKVTPERPVPMSGYASRTKPFDGVAGDLYVKALVLQDSAGHRGAIITSDLIGFTAAIAEPICERIAEQTSLQREQILLNSSHTHAGPTLSLKPPAADAADAAEALRTVDYTHDLQDKVVQAVVQAASKLEPAKLSWGGGVIHFAMNRREFTPNGVILGVNPRGLADRSVPVLRIDSPDGKLRAVLFGAGTHGTTLGPDNYQLCGDYAGFAQAQIEERLPHVQAMFMLGCAGDSNPYPRGTMDMTREHGVTLANEVCRVLETKFRPVSGPLQIAFSRVDLPLQTALTREALKQIAANKRNAQSYAAERMLAQLDKGEQPPAFYNAPISVWQFGNDLTLVGLPGEVVVDFVSFLEQGLGPNQLWVAAYCHDVFGYLPSARVLREGGYETRGLYSGGAGFFDPKAQDVVVESVRKLAQQAGRKLPE